MSLQTVAIPVSGMTCANCARTIERKLSATPGVAKAQVDLAGATATVDFDPNLTSRQELAAAIEKLGYQVTQS